MVSGCFTLPLLVRPKGASSGCPISGWLGWHWRWPWPRLGRTALPSPAHRSRLERTSPSSPRFLAVRALRPPLLLLDLSDKPRTQCPVAGGLAGLLAQLIQEHNVPGLPVAGVNIRYPPNEGLPLSPAQLLVVTNSDISADGACRQRRCDLGQHFAHRS